MCFRESLNPSELCAEFVCLCVCVRFSWERAPNFYQVLIGVHDLYWHRRFWQSGQREKVQGSVLTGSFCGAACDIQYNVAINCACPKKASLV